MAKNCNNCEKETMQTAFHKALGWDCQSCQEECPCAGCEEGDTP